MLGFTVLSIVALSFYIVHRSQEARVNPIYFGPHDISNRLIIATNDAIAFPAQMPIVPGHTLVCPKRIVATMEELTADEIQALLALVARIQKALVSAFGAQGFNIAWNDGRIAGQTVDHLHIHVVPRCQGDTGIVEYEPRKFLYRPGERTASPDEELERVAKLVLRHFC